MCVSCEHKTRQNKYIKDQISFNASAITVLNELLCSMFDICARKDMLKRNASVSTYLNEVVRLCIDSIYSLYYIYSSQHNYIN